MEMLITSPADEACAALQLQDLLCWLQVRQHLNLQPPLSARTYLASPCSELDSRSRAHSTAAPAIVCAALARTICTSVLLQPRGAHARDLRVRLVGGWERLTGDTLSTALGHCCALQRLHITALSRLAQPVGSRASLRMSATHMSPACKNPAPCCMHEGDKTCQP